MRGPEVIDNPNLLLVEGEDEGRFWTAVLTRRGRPDVQVVAVGGRDKLRLRMPAVVRTPGFDRVRWLGLMQDADDDPRAAFQRIADVLQGESLPLPGAPWVVTDSEPAVVAIVMPDGQSTGDLERLVWQSVANEAAARCVDDYMRCLIAEGRAPQREWKARVHAFLASLEQPDMQLGNAAARGLLPVRSPDLDRFVALLPPPSGG